MPIDIVSSPLTHLQCAAFDAAVTAAAVAAVVSATVVKLSAFRQLVPRVGMDRRVEHV